MDDLTELGEWGAPSRVWKSVPARVRDLVVAEYMGCACTVTDVQRLYVNGRATQQARIWYYGCMLVDPSACTGQATAQVSTAAGHSTGSPYATIEAGAITGTA